MPKRMIGPFTGLSGLSAIDVNTADDLDILERCDLINGVLAEAGCNCNGHAAGHQRDEHWGGDLSELVCRCTAHEISGVDDNGTPISETVSIKIETLRVEVDGNNEICAWVYEES